MMKLIRNISIASVCFIYVLVSLGFIQHTCEQDGKTQISFLAQNDCKHCEVPDTANDSCCGIDHDVCDSEIAEKCCFVKVQTIDTTQISTETDDDQYSSDFTFVAIVLSAPESFLESHSKQALILSSPLYEKTPKIYHTGQLRL